MSAKEYTTAHLREERHSFYQTGPSRDEFSHARGVLCRRLQKLLTDNPAVRSFSIGQIVTYLEEESASAPVALFAAANLLEPGEANFAPGAVCAGIGLSMATARETHRIPRAILRRRIPRNALSLLVHAVTAALKACDRVIHPRWSWVFHPAMQVSLGVVIFLLALASMAPIVGGGVQYAASTFLMAVGLAERDGLVVVIGALSGMAALALGVLSVSSGRKVWRKVRHWLLRCARSLRLAALAQLLDRCRDGLGDLVRLRWSTLFLSLFDAPDIAAASTDRSDARGGRLKARARRIHFASIRAAA